jgi:hypothetical protein
MAQLLRESPPLPSVKLYISSRFSRACLQLCCLLLLAAPALCGDITCQTILIDSAYYQVCSTGTTVVGQLPPDVSLNPLEPFTNWVDYGLPGGEESNTGGGGGGPQPTPTPQIPTLNVNCLRSTKETVNLAKDLLRQDVEALAKLLVPAQPGEPRNRCLDLLSDSNPALNDTTNQDHAGLAANIALESLVRRNAITFGFAAFGPSYTGKDYTYAIASIGDPLSKISILINAHAYIEMSDSQRLRVLAHELGHTTDGGSFSRHCEDFANPECGAQHDAYNNSIMSECGIVIDPAARWPTPMCDDMLDSTARKRIAEWEAKK